MRLTSFCARLALTAALAAPAMTVTGLAQDQSTDPGAAAQNFGPRANKAGAPGAPAPPESMGKFGAWDVQCVTQPAPQGSDQTQVKSCGMVQIAQNDKNKNVGVSVIVSKMKRGDQMVVFMRVMAPIGVYLPTGIPIEIDGAALPTPLQFSRCAPRVCEAMGEASPESLKKFMKGSNSTFYIYDRPGNGYPLPISLDGFAKAMAELDKY